MATGGENKKVPEEFLKLTKNPPSISKKPKTTFTFNESSAIIEGNGFFSFLTLEETKDGRVKYRFRTFSKTHGLEITGKGVVFEKYYRITDPKTGATVPALVDKGSKLKIDAGLFTLQWSLGNHIYLDKGITAAAATEAEYDERIRGGGGGTDPTAAAKEGKDEAK